MTLILDVKTRWNSTLAMLERAYRLRPYTREWLENYPDFQPLYTTDDEWHTVEYVLEVLTPFRYWTLWLSKRHTITLHRVISIYNEMFDHMEGAMNLLKSKQTAWKKDVHHAVQAAHRKLQGYYAQVTPESGLLLILAALLDPFRKAKTFKLWDSRMNIDPRDPTSYTFQYTEAFLSYWEENYVLSDGPVPGVKIGMKGNPFIEGETQSSEEEPLSPGESLYFSDSEDADFEETARPIYPGITPARASRQERMKDVARSYLSTLPVDIASIDQRRPNIDDLKSEDPDEMTAGFWKPDVAAYWLQQEENFGEYAVLARMARDIFSVIPHGVGVESSFSLGRDLIGWRQSSTNGETLRRKVIVRQYARSNPGLLPRVNDHHRDAAGIEKKEQKEEDRKLMKLAGIRDHVNFKRCRKDRRRAKESLTKKNSLFGYISDTAEMEPAGWELFDDRGKNAFLVHGKPPALKPNEKVTTKAVRSYRLKRILRVDRRPGTTDIDTDDADTDDSGTEVGLEGNGMVSDDDEEEEVNLHIEDTAMAEDWEKQERPAATVFIHDFDPPKRRSPRLAEPTRGKSRSVSPAQARGKATGKERKKRVGI